MLASWYLQLLATGLDIPLLNKDQMAVVLEKFKSYGLRIEE